MRNREAELKLTTFSSLLLFPVFLSFLLGLLLNNNNNNNLISSCVFYKCNLFGSCGLDKVIILWDLEKFENLKIIPVFESLTGIILKPPGMDFIGTESVKDKDNVIFTIGNKG